MDEKENTLDANASPETPAPSVDSMIAASHTEPTGGDGGVEAIQGVQLRIIQPGQSRSNNTGSAQPQGEARRGRGRPRSGGSTATAAKPGVRQSKADIEKERDELKRTLDAELARNDKQKVQQLGDMASVAMDMYFSFMATRRGPHWLMSDGERKAVADTAGPALAPYYDMLMQFGPMGMFAAVVVTMHYQRIGVDKELLKKWEAANGGDANKA